MATDMAIQAAVHCYRCARAAGNTFGALRHLRTIRAELRYRRALNRFRNTYKTDRVSSVFACAAAIEDF